MITELLMAMFALAPLASAPVPAVPSRAAAAEADTIPEARLELLEVVESALRTHPSVAGASARLGAASATAGEARSARLPAVSLSAMATQHQEPMVVAPLHGFDVRRPPEFDETLYQAHASAEWTLFDGGARGARIRAASALATSAESGLAAARDGVVAEATSSYLAALTAREVLGAHEERALALAGELERARLLFQEGKTPRLAVLRAEAALSRARAEEAAAEEALRLALRRLARVSGLDEARVGGAVLAEVSAVMGEVPDRDALVRAALARNPGLSQAGGRVAAAETQVAAARSSYLPRVSLTGGYSAFAAPSVDVTGEWQAGVQVRYPVFTGGARSAGVDRAEAEAEAARSERRLAEQQVADAVDAALLAYRSARARVTALEAAVAQSAEVARIEALALASGAGVQTDWLRSEAELLEARSALAEARHATVEARVRLARATGELTVDWLARMTERAEQ